MPLKRMGTKQAAPRAESTRDKVCKAFDSGLNTTRAIADAAGTTTTYVHNTLNRWRPGWKPKMANWVDEPPTVA